MLELALTTTCCKEIVTYLLERRGWSISRIARTIGAPVEYVRRIQSKDQSFQVSDVESLAKAIGLRPAMLLFESLKRSDLSPKIRELYDMAGEQIELHEDFQKVLSPKPAKKRRSPTKAA